MSAAASPPWRTFAIACTAVFLVSLDATILFAAFPALRGSFQDASAGELSWVLNAYTVVYAALLVPAGRLADLHGRRRMFTLGTAVFLLGSLGCALAGDVALLIAMRVVQAVGAALLVPASLAIVLAAFPTSMRAVAVAAWGAVSGLAAAVGPGAGSLLVSALGWQAAFAINLPIGAYAIWRAHRALPESRNLEAGAPLDVPGVVLVIVGVAALTFGLVQSEARPWTSVHVLGAIVLGVLALALYVGWAQRTPSPAIDLTLFADRTYRYVNAATLAFGTAFAMMFFTFFLFTTSVWHYSVALAGVAVTPGPLLVIPTSIICGKIASRVGHRALLVSGALVFAFGTTWLALVPGATPAYVTAILPGMLLTGIGVGMVLPSLSAAAVAALPPTRFGVGSAVNQAVRQLGSVAGVALVIVLAGDFTTTYLTQSALAVATALLCLPVDTRPRAAS